MLKIIFIWLICGAIASIFIVPMIILHEYVMENRKMNVCAFSNICRNTNLLNTIIRGPIALLGLIIVGILDVIYIFCMIYDNKKEKKEKKEK